jgi:glucosamine-6-phosphate deaminase
MRTLTYGLLRVSVADSGGEASDAAATHFAAAAASAIDRRGDIAVIMATGNSQLEFARALRSRDDIDWSRITVLHMDEYLGMREDHPASFRRWIRREVVNPCHPRAFEGIRGDWTPIAAEVDRYSAVLRELNAAICVMGIGENGHLAFNDPPADFETRDPVRLFQLDEASRAQQVGEGHFRSLGQAPEIALTVTIPALLRPETVIVVTPESRKAVAVRAALTGPVTPNVPASILQKQAHAHLYLDRESASLLDLAAAGGEVP